MPFLSPTQRCQNTGGKALLLQYASTSGGLTVLIYGICSSLCETNWVDGLNEGELPGRDTWWTGGVVWYRRTSACLDHRQRRSSGQLVFGVNRSCHIWTRSEPFINSFFLNFTMMSRFLCTLSLRFNGHFPGEPELAGVYWSKWWWRWWWELDYWSYKSCKAPVKSSPPTNQDPVFYRLDALSVAQPSVSEHWREKVLVVWFTILW